MGPTGGRRRPPRHPAGRQLHPAVRSRRSTRRRGHIRVAGRSAAGLPPVAPAVRERRVRYRADRHAGVAGAARADGRPASLGPGGPALQRDVGRFLGRRGPGRSRGSGRVGRLPAPGRLRAGQPPARGRAHRAHGALPLPAHLAALHQPALSAGRGHRRVRIADRTRSGTQTAASLRAAGTQSRHDRSRRGVGRQT